MGSRMTIARSLGVLLCCGPLAGCAAIGESGLWSSAPPMQVGVYDDFGAGSWLPIAHWIESMESVEAHPVRARQIRAGQLTRFDVIVFPGGMASDQFHALGPEGRDEVRAFVRDGGGYVGLCAGAYLAANEAYPWGLGLVDAQIVDPEHWERGTGSVEVELTALGRTVIGGAPRPASYYYANGPILAPGGDPDLDDYRTLAVFLTTVSENGADPGVMLGAPAVILGDYGAGRAILSSGHAEWTLGLEHWLHRFVEWAGGRR